MSESINIEIEENTRTAVSLDSQMAYDPDLGKRPNFGFLMNYERQSEHKCIIDLLIHCSVMAITVYINPIVYTELYARACVVLPEIFR